MSPLRCSSPSTKLLNRAAGCRAAELPLLLNRVTSDVSAPVGGPPHISEIGH
jgi:hypothetical protein